MYTLSNPLEDYLMSNELPSNNCIPHLNEHTSWCFVEQRMLTSWTTEVDGHAVPTSALRFNTPVNMIGMSTVTELLAANKQSMMDYIAPLALITEIVVTVDSRFATVEKGDTVVDQVIVKRITLDPFVQFAKKLEAANHHLSIDREVTLDLLPDAESPAEPIKLHIKAQLDIQSGNLVVDCTSDSPKVTPIGFVPYLNRGDSNTQ